jgi:hypothetical protein
MELSSAHLATLRAAMDRIVPGDEFPSASEAGVEGYIRRQLQGDLRSSAPTFVLGLEAIENESKRQFNRTFSKLALQEQDDLLRDIEAGRVADWPIPAREFFFMLRDLTIEGYYADPGNGGNLNEISWRMIGFNPRVGGGRLT